MTAAEGSFIGIAKQVAKGTPNITDASFQYLLARELSVAPNNISIPLDNEIGGGALPRSMVRVGVTSGGAIDMVPRPDSLGNFLMGALGKDTKTDGAVGAAGSYSHAFTLDPTDNFTAPYYTIRNAPGGAWGEQYQDQRISALSLNFRGARYVDGQVGFTGGLPKGVSTAAWSALAKVDGGPQFISTLSTIELPTGSAVKVLGGSFVSGMAIPLDEQWIVGSYVPDAFDITRRTFALNLTVKIADAGVLYKKMSFDPAGGTDWVASLFKEGNIKIQLVSDQYASTDGTTTKYSLSIAANAQAAGAGNVYWSAQPLGLRAGHQLIMGLTGLFTADPTGAFDPITVTLVNKHATAY